MQIHLFDDSKVTDNVSKNFGRLKSSAITLKEDFTEVKSKLIGNGISYVDLQSIERNIRNVNSILGLETDSHYLIERLGLSKTSRNYIIEIDFENCLDLVLSIVSGCNIESFRNLSNYDRISKSLLNLKDLDIPLNTLIFLDSNLDNYIYKFNNGCEEFCIRELLKDILDNFTNCLKYIGFYLQSSLDGVVFKSINRSKIVLTSYNNIEFNEILVSYGGVDKSVAVEVHSIN